MVWVRIFSNCNCNYCNCKFTKNETAMPLHYAQQLIDTERQTTNRNIKKNNELNELKRKMLVCLAKH